MYIQLEPEKLFRFKIYRRPRSTKQWKYKCFNLVPSLIIKNQYKKYIERYIDNGKNLMSRKRIRVATYQSLRQITQCKIWMLMWWYAMKRIE